MARKKAQNVTLTAEMRIVVLQGPEPMLRKLRLSQLRDALKEKHADDMEPIVIDGATAQLADVFDEVREYSLLQPHKLVVVENAEAFVTTHRKALERYAESPVDHTTLVLRSDTWRPGNLDKLIDKVGAVVRCDAPSAAEAMQWAVARCSKEHGRTLDRRAAELIVQRVGPHLMQLDNELSRLSLMVSKGQPITADLVERNVRQSSDEQAYMVQEAMLRAMSEGRAGPLIEKMHELIELSGQSDVQIAYFLGDMLRRFHVASGLMEEGVSSREIARELKLWGPREGMFFGVLRELGPAGARRLLGDAMDAMVRSRQGLGDPLRNLEGFCVRLVDQVH